MAKKTASQSLPENPSDWQVEHDLIVFRRVAKLLGKAPGWALARMRPYLQELVEQDGRPDPMLVQRAELPRSALGLAGQDRELLKSRAEDVR